jgi:23S rRNA (adenine2030-N6)-methyltransferase
MLRKLYRSINPPTLCCEFLRSAIKGTALAGSGLIICNPPWQFEGQLKTLCRELILALEAQRGGFQLEWWIREAD